MQSVCEKVVDQESFHLQSLELTTRINQVISLCDLLSQLLVDPPVFLRMAFW